MPPHVIYARKSTESDDRQVLSIDSQIQELKLLAVRRGLSDIEILRESHSAKAPGRPVFDALLKRVRKKEIAGVLCWKMDRLARNHLDTGQVLQALADGCLPAVITPERSYTADGNDRFLGSFELGMATKYIDDLRANVKRGNRARFQRGWPNFRPPPGYLEDRASKTIVKDPVRFSLVRRMWDLLLSGRMRPSQILREANDKWGFRTRRTARQGGKPIGSSILYSILANPYYMGLIRLSSGETYKGSHEAMVSPQEFDRAQEILGRPGRSRPIRHEFAYSGILRCQCGGSLLAEEHVKPSGLRYVYYRCHGRRSEKCPESSLPESRFEEQLLAELPRFRLSPRAASWIRSRVESSLRNSEERVLASAKSLQAALDQAIREGDALLTLRLRDQVTEQDFERRRLAILDLQAKLRLRLERPAPKIADLMAVMDRAMDLAARAQETIREQDIVGRRQLVQAIASNWTVKSRKALYKAKNPFVSFEKGKDSSAWWAIVEDVRTWLLNDSHDQSISIH